MKCVWTYFFFFLSNIVGMMLNILGFFLLLTNKENIKKIIFKCNQFKVVNNNCLKGSLCLEK